MKTKTENKDQPTKNHQEIKKNKIKNTKKMKTMGNRLQCILGSSRYCKEA